jgi:hypothetical protein
MAETTRFAVSEPQQTSWTTSVISPTRQPTSSSICKTKGSLERSQPPNGVSNAKTPPWPEALTNPPSSSPTISMRRWPCDQHHHHRNLDPQGNASTSGPDGRLSHRSVFSKVSSMLVRPHCLPFASCSG